MKTLHGMVLKNFLPVFLTALAFFVLVLELVDLFKNLWRFLSNDVSFTQMLSVAVYYLPKCIMFGLPIALLFSVAFTLGSFYSNNELISVFGSGISLFRLVLPLILAGLVLSVASFYFEEIVVIDSFRIKNQLTGEFLGRRQSQSNTNVTVVGENIIYHCDYYNDSSETLSGLIVLERDNEGRFIRRIDAEWATWDGNLWELHRCRIFTWDHEGKFLTEQKENLLKENKINEPPGTFRKTMKNVEELRIAEAGEWIESRRKAGLPHRELLTDYYKRYSFALTPLMVTFLSSALGGSFRKNILLMSLLSSLVLTVIYYVFQMVMVIFANLGFISPMAGAWAPFFFFSAAGIWLFRIART
jgi:lipopolysaccharide export system permease protein